MPLARERDVAIAAVRAACGLCETVRARAGGPATVAKEDRSPVTVADFAAQAVVNHALAQAFPGDPVVAEEDSSELRADGRGPLRREICVRVGEVVPGLDGEGVIAALDRGNGAGGPAGRFWTVDPIDGTRGFLRGDQYAVALALLVDGRPEVGVLGCPRLPLAPGDENGPVGVLFVAVRGAGPVVRPIDGNGDEGPARVDPSDDPASVRFCEPFERAHSSHSTAARVAAQLGVTTPPVRLDSQAKYGAVARGDAAVYLRLPTKPGYREKIWDHAAGALVVEEAGGRVTDAKGRPLDFTRGATLDRNRGVIATNGVLHDRVIAAVRAVAGEGCGRS